MTPNFVQVLLREHRLPPISSISQTTLLCPALILSSFSGFPKIKIHPKIVLYTLQHEITFLLMHIQKQVIGWNYNLSLMSWYSDAPYQGGSGRGGIGLPQRVLLFTSIKI